MRKTGVCGSRKPKKRFPDEYSADQMLRRAQERAVREGGIPPVRWYFHGACQGFHLTSQPLEGS